MHQKELRKHTYFNHEIIWFTYRDHFVTYLQRIKEESTIIDDEPPRVTSAKIEIVITSAQGDYDESDDDDEEDDDDDDKSVDD